METRPSPRRQSSPRLTAPFPTRPISDTTQISGLSTIKGASVEGFHYLSFFVFLNVRRAISGDDSTTATVHCAPKCHTGVSIAQSLINPSDYLRCQYNVCLQNTLQKMVSALDNPLTRFISHSFHLGPEHTVQRAQCLNCPHHPQHHLAMECSSNIPLFHLTQQQGKSCTSETKGSLLPVPFLIIVTIQNCFTEHLRKHEIQAARRLLSEQVCCVQKS